MCVFGKLHIMWKPGTVPTQRERTVLPHAVEVCPSTDDPLVFCKPP